MIPSRNYDRILSVPPSTADKFYDFEQRTPSSQLQIEIDGIDLVENNFQYTSDSDAESTLTDSSESVGSDGCILYSINKCSEDHHFSFRQLPHALRAHSRGRIRQFFDDSSIGQKNNQYSGYIDDESESVLSMDSLDDARKRGISEWSKTKNSAHSASWPQQMSRRRGKVRTEKLRDLDAENEGKQSDYRIPLK